MRKTFNYQREEKINPNIGIMSFQHFNGEEIYSDIVVKPENNMTETENVECYPVPDYVPQNGRQEGYYPDASVVYIRSLWKEFEPEQGVYNYDFIEDFLRKADEHNQTVCFRLIGHSTRACDDVPDWLKKLIPCPERPEGKRVKDSPTDHLYVELFCKAIRKIGERFDSDPRLAYVDISVPGAWGEGHKLELFGDEVIWEMFETYIEAFPTTTLMGQVGLPHLLHKTRERRKIGVRGDGYGSPHHTEELYPPKMEKVADFWKDSPISFESFWWIGEWQRQGWDYDRLIELSLGWHISTFNAKSIPIPFEWKEKTDYWNSKMGYHYTIKEADFPEKTDKPFEVKLSMANVGVAPIYDKVALKIRLKNSENEYVFDTNEDLLKWLPGDYNTTTTIDTKGIASGSYSLQVGVIWEGKTVYLATDAKRDENYYVLGEIVIGPKDAF